MTTPPKFHLVASGDWETADGQYRCWRLIDVNPPAWNVEYGTDWVNDQIDRDPEHVTAHDFDLIVDGADSKRTAIELFNEWWVTHHETPEEETMHEDARIAIAETTEPTPAAPPVRRPIDMTYVSDVEYEVTVDGEVETRKLTITFQGGPTDYYWNSSAARDFYAERIEREGGTVRRYGTHGPIA